MQRFLGPVGVSERKEAGGSAFEIHSLAPGIVILDCMRHGETLIDMSLGDQKKKKKKEKK